jgi:hypothetical protein
LPTPSVRALIRHGIPFSDILTAMTCQQSISRAIINEKTIADFKRAVEQTSILRQEPNRLIAPTPP